MHVKAVAHWTFYYYYENTQDKYEGMDNTNLQYTG